MVALGADPAAHPPAFTIEPSVAGRGEWINTSTYIFYPEPAMAGADDDGNGEVQTQVQTPVRHATGAIDPGDQSSWGKVSRNAACPCGSGKKYKHCHGRLT